ncbi:phage tail tape measure protein [Desulfoplanes formicivorans]|uniref:Phage tail tape measure protein domain-containing protein n=1 Tax=Desulfoplanes formicivorans TaxID=1592317 RepID=A0A194AHA9_9BACT|nr:phage tail tape measure protein [Desulfoplanes formicivorans]GAU08144.1 hypothetical protein DPF_0847 [Desulfoplanes formicivorans]
MNSNTVKITLQVDDKGSVKVKSMGKALDSMGQDATRAGSSASKSMASLNSQIGRTTKGAELMAKAMKGAMAYFSVRALAAFETSIASVGMSFEHTMKTVQGVSRATDEQYKALTAAAREMGETTEWSATQAAEALKYMSMAGFTVEQSIAALPGVLDLATAGNLDLGRASDIVTDSLTAMGLGVEDLAHFSDVLIATTTRSNTNIEMMGESLKYAAPIAHSMGYEIEQVSALLGTLANAGIKASDAGTDLRQAMLRNSKAAAELGTRSDDLIGTIKAARDANWDATKVQEEWGIIASKSVLVLMEQIDQYEKLYGQLQNVDGATSALAGSMRDDTLGAWKEFKSVVESVRLDIFERQSNGVKTALRFLSGEIRENKDSIVSFGEAIVDTMEASTWAVETLALSVNGLGGAFDAFKLGIAEAEEFLLDLYTSIPTWMLPESMELSAVTIDALRETIRQTKEEATKDIIDTSTTIEGLHGKFESLRDALRDTGDTGKQSMANIEKAAKSTAKSVDSAIKSVAKADSSYIKSSNDIYKKGLQRRGDLLTKWEKSQLDSQEDLVKEFEELTGDQYEFERQAIREKARLYDDAGADKVKVAEWARKEIEKVNKREVDDAEDAFRLKALAGDDFFDGLKAGYDDNLGYARTWGETGYDIVSDFFRSSRGAASDLLFDAIKGDMDSLGSYWESFWDSMLRSMTDYVTQMATEWATSNLISWGASFADSLLTFHTGTTGIKQDELLAILQQGEMVIPAKQAETIRQAIDNGGMSADGYFDAVSNAVSIGTRASGYVAGSWDSPDIAGHAIGALQSSVLGGVAAGINNFSAVSNMGKALQNAGYDISSSAIKDAAFDQAVSGFVSAAIPGFAGTFMGNLTSDVLGVSDYATAGKIVGYGLSVLSGVNIPGAMIAALSPVTALAISSIADAMDLRSDETLKDALEDKYGHITGRRAYAAAQDKLSEIGAKISEYGSLAAYGFDPENATSIVGYQPFGVGEVSLNLETGRISDSLGRVAVGPYGSFVDVGSLAEAAGLVGGGLGDALGDISGSLDSLGSLGIDTDSLSKAWADAALEAAKEAGWGSGSGSGGYGPSGGLGSSGGFGPSDAAGGGPSSGGSTSSTGGNSGYGRYAGGPVSPGYMYEINERGQELFMPGVDGRIMTADETKAMLTTLKQIAAGGGSDMAAALYAIAKYCQKSMKILDRWDHIGMPEVRA